MATSKISATEGVGVNIATHSISEDAVTKQIQRVNLNDSAGAEITTLPVSLATNTPLGNIAHDAADSGNPIKVGAQARTTNPTAVADSDRANIISDKIGRLVTVNSVRDLKGVQTKIIASSTAETTIVDAGGSGVFNDLTKLVIANTSASACNVTIRASSGGATAFVFAVPAGDTRGFASSEPSIQSSSNNAWTAQCGTSVDSIIIRSEFVKNI